MIRKIGNTTRGPWYTSPKAWARCYGLKNAIIYELRKAYDKKTYF